MNKRLPFDPLPLSDWPPSAKGIATLREACADPFVKPDAVSQWKDKTFRLRIQGVAWFLGWLRWSSRQDKDVDFEKVVTREVLRAYVDDMRSFDLSPRTIATRLDSLRAVACSLSPDQDTKWLMTAINQLRREPSDRRRKWERTRPTGDYVTLGMNLMRGACRNSQNVDELTRAISFRDGLLIVFCALVVPRLQPFHLMTVGQHLIETGSTYRVRWSAGEMKTAQAYDCRLGPELSDLIRRYLSDFRPILLSKGEPQPGDRAAALWITRSGTQMSPRNIYDVIIRRTQVAFGVSIFPHAFRHSACTTLALKRPDLIEIATPLLQHRSESSRQYYNLATRFEAGKVFSEAIEQMRRGRRGRLSGRRSTDGSAEPSQHPFSRRR